MSSIENLSSKELAELLAKRRQQEQNETNQRRDAYEALKSEIVAKISQKVTQTAEQTKQLFDFVVGETAAFYQIMKEYGALRTNEQRSFTLQSDNFKVEVKINNVKKFDERADIAASSLIEFLREWISNREQGVSDPMYQLAMTLIERNKNGDLDYKSISKLYDLETKFKSDEYSQIMTLFKESNVVEGTATNFYFYEKTELGVWRKIEPSFIECNSQPRAALIRPRGAKTNKPHNPMTTTELQTRIERLTEQSTGVNRALERAKTNLAEALAREAQKSDLTITIAGLRFAKVNLGTDVDHPLGRHYNDNGEADAAIPRGWRRPTEADHVQLYERTTRTPTERDGVKGLLFKDKETGAEMFMPYAGYITPDGRLEGAGEVGAYWSSTRYPSSAYYSYSLDFHYNGTVNPSNYANRSGGLSVRCVQE